jgi:hypothetical protein
MITASKKCEHVFINFNCLGPSDLVYCAKICITIKYNFIKYPLVQIIKTADKFYDFRFIFRG